MNFVVADSPKPNAQLVAAFQVIERKARLHGMPEVLIALDRLAEIRGIERLEEASNGLWKILEMINSKNPKRTQ